MVKLAPAKIVALSDRLEVTGSVEPTRVARMASPVDGPVIACPVREGDRVRRGQLLARLGRGKGDDATAKAARAELSREELEFERIERLVKSGALPGEELDKTRGKVSEARARLARATERLGDYRIAAPWSGIVSRVHVAEGDFVAARTTLIDVLDPDSLVLRFAVPENRAAAINTDMAITVTLDAHPDQSFTGTVTRVYPEIDRQTHTRTAEGVLNGEVELVPGMFARIEVVIASVPNAVTIPEPALLRKGDKTIAFVVGPDNQAEQRRMKTGITDNALVQNVEGIAPGDRVAIAGHARLRDGMKVRVAGAGKSGKDKSGKDKSGKDKSDKDKSGKDKSGKDKSGKDKSGKDKSEQSASKGKGNKSADEPARPAASPGPGATP